MSDDIAYSAAKHPGEHRDRVGWAELFYGLFAAPTFWAGNNHGAALIKVEPQE